MSQASDWLEDRLLDHLICIDTTFTGAATLYVALCTAAPTDASTGSTITEATYTGYARKSTTAADWGASSGGTKSNSAAITFAACTGGSSTVTHFAICDALTLGNVFCYGTLTSQLAVSNGITPEFAIGDLDISLD